MTAYNDTFENKHGNFWYSYVIKDFDIYGVRGSS